MRQVNIYTMSSLKGIRAQDGKVIYILELPRPDKVAVTLNKTSKVENVTPNKSELLALIGSMKRLTEKCELSIYTESEYIAAGITTWLKDWKEKDWKNARGELIANCTEWQELSELLKGNTVECHVKEQHSFRNWMMSQLSR